MQEVIKLKIKKTKKTESIDNLVIEKFIESCLRLDASIFEPLIEEDQYFEEMDKYRFLDSLKINFDKLINLGITETVLKIDKCRGCTNGHKTHEFHAKEEMKFSYIIYLENGKLLDIYQCNLSNGFFINLQNL